MDHAEQSAGAGWERSEMAGRAHSSFPYSENSVTGEYHYRGMHQPQKLSWELSVSDRGVGMAKKACLPCRGAVYTSRAA